MTDQVPFASLRASFATIRAALKFHRDNVGSTKLVNGKNMDYYTWIPDAENCAAIDHALAALDALQVWEPLKLGTHEVHDSNGELAGWLTVTPMKTEFLSIVDDCSVIPHGVNYRLCRRVVYSEALEGPGEEQP